jgi:hypothetical protein
MRSGGRGRSPPSSASLSSPRAIQISAATSWASSATCSSSSVFGLTRLALDPAPGSFELWPVAVAIDNCASVAKSVGQEERDATRCVEGHDLDIAIADCEFLGEGMEHSHVSNRIGRICPIAAGGEPAGDRHAFARRKGRRCDPATVELGTRTAAGPEFDRGGGLPLRQTTARSASTHAGSNCRPASVRISSRAASRVRGCRYGRGSIIAWKQSATATIRAASGISSARFPSG